MDEVEHIYQKAVQENSWKELVGHPFLLFRWQYTHPADNMRIATVASHKLGNHTYCQTPEKCEIVSKFIQAYSAGQQMLPVE